MERICSRHVDVHVGVVVGFEEVERLAEVIGQEKPAANKGAKGLAALAELSSGAQGPAEEQAQIMQALNEAGIDPKRRAETLTVEEWGRLSDQLRDLHTRRGIAAAASPRSST